LWHGDSHLIADDHLNWKNKCPTFNHIIKRLAEYFGMDVKATRFNWYRDSSEWKPYHHDAAAVDASKAMKQNFTVGVSFGLTRDAAFEHAKTRTTVEFPLTDGSVYCFSKDVNIEWRHGIPQVPPSQYSDKGRISIIAWGWVDQFEK
jgi:alkylated DNA repair dioxygenase AlkB